MPALQAETGHITANGTNSGIAETEHSAARTDRRDNKPFRKEGLAHRRHEDVTTRRQNTGGALRSSGEETLLPVAESLDEEDARGGHVP